MATENDITLAPARWAVKLGKKLHMPMWLIVAVLGLIAVAALVWFGSELVNNVDAFGHKWLIAAGTIIVTVGGLVALFGESERVRGRRERAPDTKAGDAAKTIGLVAVFIGGFVLSAVAVMDALGKF